MYTSEINSLAKNTSVITFPNREAVYKMINTKDAQKKENIQSSVNENTANCNHVFEALLTLLLLDETYIKKNLFALITAFLLSN